MMNPTEKALVQNLQTHDLAERYRLRRATLAKEAGLPAEAFALPFPGNQVTTTNHTGAGLIKGALLAAALLGAGGGGVLGLAHTLDRFWPGRGRAVAQEPPSPPDALAEDYDVRLEQQAPDGTWKPLSSQRLKVEGRGWHVEGR